MGMGGIRLWQDEGGPWRPVAVPAVAFTSGHPKVTRKAHGLEETSFPEAQVGSLSAERRGQQQRASPLSALSPAQAAIHRGASQRYRLPRSAGEGTAGGGGGKCGSFQACRIPTPWLLRVNAYRCYL